jgi:hypothetical protein
VAQGYSFQTFAQYLKEQANTSLSSPHRPVSPSPPRTSTERSRSVLLRHDVESHYEQALKFAEIQHTLGIRGTYYFRILPKSFKPEIVKKIAELGHEIGYHYDDLAVCKGDTKKAIVRFQKNLKTLRDIAPVETICMDGSPLSRYDNKALWNNYNYRDFGIIGEPYYDVDFDKVFYLTDTGRRWDGWKTSVRDKVPQQEEWVKQGLVFHSTQDIVKAIEEKFLPNQVLFTFHPQRWTDGFFLWIKEMVLQTAKNQVKKILIRNHS